MHPQLTDKRIVCKEFIQALEKCHEEWWGARFFGSCNEAKRALNMCLRKERVDRAAKNREVSKERKERRAKTEAAWKQLEMEMGGSEKSVVDHK